MQPTNTGKSASNLNSLFDMEISWICSSHSRFRHDENPVVTVIGRRRRKAGGGGDMSWGIKLNQCQAEEETHRCAEDLPPRQIGRELIRTRTGPDEMVSVVGEHGGKTWHAGRKAKIVRAHRLDAATACLHHPSFPRLYRAWRPTSLSIDSMSRSD